MKGVCKMSKQETVWPCSAASCPLFGDCLVEYEKAAKKPQANADRIRAMSDDELAEYLVYHNPYSTESNCLRWLQQPAEEAP